MATDQRNDEFTEPAFEDIAPISRMHVPALEASDDDRVWTAGGMHHVVLRTLGRKSGNEHKVALPYWLDPEGHRIVVGSYAGAPFHPHWYLNLSDRTANPEVHVQVQGGKFWADAEVLDGPEYERIWGLLTTDREYYRNYQTRTSRRIPLVRLRELRPA